MLRPALRVAGRTALLALGCNALLELIRVVGVEEQPWRYKEPWFALLFLLGTVVVWLLVGLVHAVLGRLWLTGTVMVTLTVVVGLADHEKVQFRHEPLFPSDWSFVQDMGLLLQIAGTRFLVLVAVGAVVAAVAAFFAVRALRRRARRRTRAGGRDAWSPGHRGARLNACGKCVRRTYGGLAAVDEVSQQRNYLRRLLGASVEPGVPPVSCTGCNDGQSWSGAAPRRPSGLPRPGPGWRRRRDGLVGQRPEALRGSAWRTDPRTRKLALRHLGAALAPSSAAVDGRAWIRGAARAVDGPRRARRPGWRYRSVIWSTGQRSRRRMRRSSRTGHRTPRVHVVGARDVGREVYQSFGT